MTLRSKIALALAVLAGLAALAVASAAYVATGARLEAEVDESLNQNARRILNVDGRVRDALCAGQVAPRPRGPLDELTGPGATVQCLAPDGEVIGSTGAVELPVDATDRAIAADGVGVRTRTVDIDGEPYRIQTAAAAGGGAVQIARDYSESQRILDGLRRQLLAIGIVVTAAGALAGWLVARTATRPLVRLTDAAEEVADTGRLDVALPPSGGDEPGRLARAFGAMLAALARSRDQQQQLVQDAGHELRTPLTSVRTNIELLARYDLPEATRVEVLTDLDRESRELSGLVDELVQLATEGVDDEPIEVIDLGVVVREVAERAARRSGRSVVVGGPAATIPMPVAGRRRALARAIGNLVDNALKFSPPDTPVEVSMVAPARVEVRDHGPGVASDDRNRVFERFYRSAEARALPGSGLGLAIVSQTAAAHGGAVSVGDHPAGGAVFTFELPAAAEG
ncbi:HAMP domain-containing sensor histidine kinase [Rhabdothermincola salaria]|uniref:HAMP domain-containing sensor histidine kinase n=1 Tax=Rhabdothermincola salaria TaxID=2903142 RepID=UPI001E556512|nr:HAMP domain-containing sensor histidine kinase [Rhabdothermincola salaria]MCD9625456.1 HAMP domain-containing histidine kinase [Rhabdothermincola salaria]